MKTLRKFKRGDTFSFISNVTNQAGQIVVGVADKLKAELRNSVGDKIADLTITETEIPGSYLFTALDTSEWRVTTLYTDIQYTDGEIITSSETIAIPMEKDITL